jgi:pilus assembly protein Flp/PilA
MRTLHDLLKDESGATAVEYGLILALIFLAMIVALQGFAAQASAMWSYVAGAVLGA